MQIFIKNVLIQFIYIIALNLGKREGKCWLESPPLNKNPSNAPSNEKSIKDIFEYS